MQINKIRGALQVSENWYLCVYKKSAHIQYTHSNGAGTNKYTTDILYKLFPSTVITREILLLYM